MYYENKRTFYIKQYGPAVLILLVAVILIGTGIYIALKPKNEVANNNPGANIVDSNNYELSNESYEGKVKSVNGLSIVVEAQGTTQEINLIGIKQHKRNKGLNQQISKDLVGKTVTVDFDSTKTEKGKTYAYVYVDGALYNETLLKQGSAELRTERQNVNKLDILLAAQLSAKHDLKGIWSY